MTPISSTRRRRFRATLLAILTTVGVITGLVVQAGPASADVDSVAGSATALTIGGGPVAPSVSGSATEPQDGYGPIGSGFLPSGVACPSGALVPPGGLPLLLSIGLLDACTRGGGVAGDNHLGFAESSSAVANVVIGGNVLGLVRSACRADGNGAVGSTQIIGSGIPGLPTNPAPNTVVGVPGPLGLITLTLNEQFVTNTPGTADITVRAVHLNLLGIDIILAESNCTALGPDVNVTTTTSTTTTVPGATTTTSTTLPGATTTTSTTLPGATTTVPPGGGVGVIVVPPGNVTNTNTNNNTSTNNNTNLNNNQNTVNVGGDTINITTPPAQITFLGHHHHDGHKHDGHKHDGHKHDGHKHDGHKHDHDQDQDQTQSQNQSQSQQQGQTVQLASTGGMLARTGSALVPLMVLAALALVLGNMIRIGSRGVAAEGAPNHLARQFPTVASARLEWGPAQIGKAMLAALAALIGGLAGLLTRRRR